MKTTLILHDKIKIEIFSTTDTLDALNTLSLILGERCARRIIEHAEIIDTVNNSSNVK